MVAANAIVGDLQSMNVNYYFKLVPFSILLYDYCLTFVAEVERCWRVRKLSWGLGLFYLNRYFTLFGHVPVMLQYFWSTSNPNKTDCRYLELYHGCLTTVIQMVVSFMLVLRLYALYERSRKVLAFYIVVGVFFFPVTCWALLGGKKESRDLKIHVGCDVTWSGERAIRFGVAWAGVLIFDSLVFGMTLFKFIILPRPNRVNIMDILFRDGAIYFGVMVVSNLTNVLTFMLGGPLTRGVVTTFTNIISSVMMSRLMLNLRKPRIPILSTIPT